VGSTPALKLIMEWLEDNADEASPESLQAAMKALACKEKEERQNLKNPSHRK
jgi:hypothetical protein